MRYSGRYKRNLDSVLISRYRGQSIYIGIPVSEVNPDLVKSIGFENIEHGVTILPAPQGNVTQENANGHYIIRKDLPKERIYHAVLWEHDEWRGRDETERVTRYVERSYKKYPRDFIAPSAKEISIFKNESKTLIISEKLNVVEENYEMILHYINMFLEMFGTCEIYNDNLEISSARIKKVNWKIFPQGHYDRTFFEENIESAVRNLSENEKQVILYRFTFINRRNPEFIALGQGGFKGYLVFAFPTRQLFILESLFEGNATYVFNENWESLSKRTKFEILSERLQKSRFIHRRNWKSYINQLFIS